MKNSGLRPKDTKLWQRLLLVALTGAVPMFIVSVLLVKATYSGSINFALQEQRGNTFQRPLEKLLDLLPRYQATTRQIAAGDDSVTRELAGLRQQIDGAMDLLAANYNGDLGLALKFNDAALALRKRDNARLSFLQAGWKNLENLSPTMAAQSDVAGQLTDSIRTMITHAGDLSNLILDDNLDSYYLMDITVSALPRAQQRLSDITLQVGDWLRHGQAGSNRTQIAVLAGLVQQDDLSRIADDAKTSLSEDRNFNGVSESLQKKLPDAVARYTAASQSWIGLLNRIAAGDQVPAKEFEAAGWHTRAESFRLWQVGADELDRLLAARVRAIELKRLGGYVIISLTLFGTAGIMGWIIRSLLDIRYAEMLKTEEELRSKEIRLRALGDNLPNGMVYQVVREADGSMRFLYVSAGIERLNGLTASAVMQDFTLFSSQILPEDLPGFLAARRDSLANKSVFNVKVRMRRSDGAVRWMQFSSAPRRLPDGRFIWDGIETDVTEQHVAAAALSQSEARFSCVFKNSPVPITLVRLADGIILDVNESFLRMSGYTREEIIGHTSLEKNFYLDPDRRAHIIDQLRQHGRLHGHEESFQTKTGQIRNIMLWVDLVSISGEQCILYINLDMTDRQRAQAELIWKTAFLEAQVDSAPDGILVVDDRAKRILQNQRLFQLFNVPDQIIHDDDDANLLRYVMNQTKNPAQFSERVAYLYAHSDEVGHDEIELVDQRIVDRYSAPVRDQAGKYYGRIWTFRDITGQRKLEAQFRQAQKMEAVGQLASGVAHDFNNILAVIQLQADMLQAEECHLPEHKDFAGEIGKAAQRAASLTRQLLLFSRQQVMQLRDIDLNDSITNITKMLERVLGEGIQMHFKHAPQPLPIHADSGMMDQVLMNLSVNARDAMPQGGHLFIETSAAEFDELAAAQFPQSRAGSFVCLNVSDTGCGIPPEVLPQIFNPFFTTKDIGKGTGLGLSTVFGIVQQHQGWINVYSEVGHGTTFRIYLPRRSGMTSQKTTPRVTASADGGHETILLVEDDLSLRNSIRTMLSKLGYHILEASTGVNALEVWKHKGHEINLLLTDLMMPDGMSGKDLAQRLLQENPRLKVMYMSGYSAEVAGKDFPLEAGVNFLAKPFETGRLAQTIRTCLDIGLPPQA